MRSRHWSHGRKPLGKIGERRVKEVRAGDVDQLRGLLLDGRNHFGMAMAGRSHGDTGGEVEKLVAVHVFHAESAAALRHQRIRTRVTGRDEPAIGLNGGFGLRSGLG